MHEITLDHDTKHASRRTLYSFRCIRLRATANVLSQLPPDHPFRSVCHCPSIGCRHDDLLLKVPSGPLRTHILLVFVKYSAFCQTRHDIRCSVLVRRGACHCFFPEMPARGCSYNRRSRLRIGSLPARLTLTYGRYFNNHRLT